MIDGFAFSNSATWAANSCVAAFVLPGISEATLIVVVGDELVLTGDSLFVVRQGRVKVVLIGEDGREVILGVLGISEHFGELALIDDRPRSAHVIAMEESHLLVLRREDFRKRVESSPVAGDECKVIAAPREPLSIGCTNATRRSGNEGRPVAMKRHSVCSPEDC